MDQLLGRQPKFKKFPFLFFFFFKLLLSLFLNKFSCLILCFLVLFFRFLEFKVGYVGGES